MDGVKKKYTTYIYPNKGNIVFNYEALLDIKIDNKINKYEERIDELDKKVDFLLSKDNKGLLKKQDLKEKSSTNINIEKAETIIDELRDNDDIRIQIQCTTRIINQLDILRKNYNIDSKKRKMIVFFRSVLKINSDLEIFSEEQLEEFRNIMAALQNDEMEYDNFMVKMERELRRVGLRTMVEWE